MKVNLPEVRVQVSFGAGTVYFSPSQDGEEIKCVRLRTVAQHVRDALRPDYIDLEMRSPD